MTAALFMRGVHRIPDAAIRDAEGKYQSKVQRRSYRVVRISDGVTLHGCQNLEQATEKLDFWNEGGLFARIERGGL